MRRSTSLLLAVASVGSLGLAASPAPAATITFSGDTLTYTAAPGESNSLSFYVNAFEGACDGLGSPCLDVSDGIGISISAPPGACRTSENPGSVTCRRPTAMVINLGDGDDGLEDWDGPSVIDMGPGTDVPRGNGGDDVILGGPGNDVLHGNAGNDTLDGGPGDDALEGVPGAASNADTSGTDTYRGGGGEDSLTYEHRGDALALSLDGVANDGAAGEGDSIDPAIRKLVGGGGPDTMTGTGASNNLVALGGDDRLSGLGGDDSLTGGLGNDQLLAGDGQDVLGGDGGDDLLDGGAGVDRFWGDEQTACIPGFCATGQDRILARDGAAEMINCGAGTDTAVVDAVDTVANAPTISDQCETVDRAGGPAPGPNPNPNPGPGTGDPGTGAPTASLRRLTLDRRGRFVVRVAAPGAGSVSVAASIRVRGRTVALGRARATVRRAGTVTLRVSPSRSARGAIRRLRRIRVTTRVSFRAAGGSAVAVTRSTTTVRRPSR